MTRPPSPEEAGRPEPKPEREPETWLSISTVGAPPPRDGSRLAGARRGSAAGRVKRGVLVSSRRLGPPPGPPALGPRATHRCARRGDLRCPDQPTARASVHLRPFRSSPRRPRSRPLEVALRGAAARLLAGPSKGAGAERRGANSIEGAELKRRSVGCWSGRRTTSTTGSDHPGRTRRCESRLRASRFHRPK